MNSASQRGRRPAAAGRREDSDQPLHLYAIGLGSNRPISGALGPRNIVRAAMMALDLPPFTVLARSPIIASAPIGPSARTYANAALLLASPLPPLAMLARLQSIEAQFGRRRQQRWGARTLDLDLLLWSGGTMRHPRLAIPHPALPVRDFVLGPLQSIVPRWRHSDSNRSIRQLAARRTHPKPVDRAGARH